MKILRQAERARRLAVSRWTESRIAKTDPTYPTEIEVSPGIRGIPEDEFDAWLQARPRRVRGTIGATKSVSQSYETEPLHDAHVREYEKTPAGRVRQQVEAGLSALRPPKKAEAK